jgi:hypothetical protein
MKMRLFSIVFITFFMIQTSVVCQTNSDSSSPDKYFKNVFYGTVGVIPNVAYNFNYERQLTNPVNDTSSIRLRLGIGGSGDLNGSEKMVLLSSNFVLGNGPGHLEIDLGAAYQFDIVRYKSDKKTGITPVISAGYRFQKKNGQFVFRTGFGWPDCIYISLGFAL